ncbi:MAG: hypothetical protein WD623_00475 [Marinobacter sp.]|uniref:AtuA-related protein n=1 Tax=Marinobacter sp. TaxID=50741 RepID=UPI0034A040A0
MKVLLRHLAHSRSGDKGNTSNITVIAYHPRLYPYICDQLTPDRVKKHYHGVIHGHVHRYEVDNLGVLNFVCEEALGGGVSRNLCLDNYGKTLASAMLNIEIDVPEALFGLMKGQVSA